MQARVKQAEVLVANLGRDVTARARAEVLAPVLEEMIDEYEGGRCKDGVHNVQQWIVELIFAAMLSSPRRFDPERVGVHPANREGAGLVPVDVHDLLLEIVSKRVVVARVQAARVRNPTNRGRCLLAEGKSSDH